MEILYKLLYRLYIQELLDANIGYPFNIDRLNLMNELVNAMYYIKHGNPTNDEIIKIIQYYGEI